MLETILAFGNYMNGDTQRGQADAFDLEVISKLKDVKSIVCATKMPSRITYKNNVHNNLYLGQLNELVTSHRLRSVIG